MTHDDLILDARAVHAWYGSSHVLHGIDLQIARGETIGLLGRNGMGKSTLIRALLGHVEKRSGQIAFFGQDASEARPHEVARLGVAYVPEGRGVFPNLSVRENLVMAARRGRDGRSDWTYDRILETFPRLKERLGNLGAQLSGGEQQMLSIGRALMSKRGLKALLPVGDRLSTIPRSSAPAMVCIKLGNAHHGQASRKGAASAPRAQRGVQERAGRTQP